MPPSPLDNPDKSPDQGGSKSPTKTLAKSGRRHAVSTPSTPGGRVTVSFELGGAVGRSLAERLAAVVLDGLGAPAGTLTEAEAAALLRHTTKWLQRRRLAQEEPGDLAKKVGGRFMYDRHKLEAWMDQQAGEKGRKG